MILYQDTVFMMYCIFLAFVIGSVMGSFLNCFAWRIAHHESITKGRSHCTSCNHPLGVFDLIPVFSWIFLKGKCRYCGEHISIRYPLTELCMGLVSVLCLFRFDISLLYVRAFAFVCILFTLSLVDLEIYEIPDGCHIAAIVLWIITLPLSNNIFEEVKDGLIGAFGITISIILIVMIMEKVLKKDALGGGDIKLFFVTGLYLGLFGSLFMIILACIIGLVLYFIKSNDESYIPFGPAISLATVFMLLYGSGFINWYLSLLM